MEVVVAFKVLLLQIVRAHLQGRSHVACERALGIGSGDEDHAPAAAFLVVEHRGLHPELLHSALEEIPQLVVADFSYVAGLHSEDGSTGDGVGGGASGDVFHPYLLESLPDLVACFQVHMLHAAEGKMKFTEKSVVRQDCQDVRKGVADS